MSNFIRWFKGYGADNEAHSELDRLRKENTELKTRVTNLQHFYDDQSEQMTELRKELVTYKMAINVSLNDSGDKYHELEDALEKSRTREYEAAQEIVKLESIIEDLRSKIAKKKSK